MKQDNTQRITELERKLAEIKAKNLNLDMTRGKPSVEQLDLSLPLLTAVNQTNFKSVIGDTRNYGVLDGVPETKKLFAELLGNASDNIFVGGNSSLNLMHDVIGFCMLFGAVDSVKPWLQSKIKFLCPVPGYDRHFAICEHFGIEMINVPMTDTGPDMNLLEQLVKEDDAIKGIWCVPKYQNPTGVVFSDEVVKRLANIQTAAADFKIFWDNAYVIHHLNGKAASLKNIHQACADAGYINRVFEFSSTSKVTFAGAGVAVVSTSSDNMAWLKKHINFQAIGYDKINQLRHHVFFSEYTDISTHMQNHATLLAPKFNAVIEILTESFSENKLVTWQTPTGGYFISIDVLPGLAKSVVALMNELGVKLTPAGATYPYGKDPMDSNLRIAPSMPSVDDIKLASQVLAVVIEYLSLKKQSN